MKLVDFKKDHLERIEKATDKVYLNITARHRDVLEQNGFSHSVIGDDGTVFMCAGVVKYWNGRGEGWAIFNKSVGASMVGVHRIVSRYLDIIPIKRVECTVEADFKEGHRWAKLLGFEMECPRMKNYFENGKDAVLYARVR